MQIATILGPDRAKAGPGGSAGAPMPVDGVAPAGFGRALGDVLKASPIAPVSDGLPDAGAPPATGSSVLAVSLAVITASAPATVVRGMSVLTSSGPAPEAAVDAGPTAASSLPAAEDRIGESKSPSGGFEAVVTDTAAMPPSADTLLPPAETASLPAAEPAMPLSRPEADAPVPSAPTDEKLANGPGAALPTLQQALAIPASVLTNIEPVSPNRDTLAGTGAGALPAGAPSAQTAVEAVAMIPDRPAGRSATPSSESALTFDAAAETASRKLLGELGTPSPDAPQADANIVASALVGTGTSRTMAGLPVPRLASTSPQVPETGSAPVRAASQPIEVATAALLPVPDIGMPSASAISTAPGLASPGSVLTGSPPAAVAPAMTVATSPPMLAHDVGAAIGLAIARGVAADGNQLHLRLEPAKLGRVDVSLSFEGAGQLRAVLAADSAVALEMLRRDSADLGRAMADAGVRADSQSFRFEGRGDGRGDGRGGENGQSRHQPGQPFVENDTAEAASETPDPSRFRQMRWRGQINVLA